jgi:Glycosyl hydrolase family 9
MRRLVKRTVPVLLVLAYCAVSTIPSNAQEKPRVHEITMAAPDIVRVEVREGAIVHGKIIKPSSPPAAAHGTWVKAEGQRWGLVIGPKNDHLRLEDQADFEKLNRKAVDDAAAYGALGDRHIIAAFRKSVPWSSGTLKRGPVVSFAHFLYLKLDQALVPGQYVLRWPHDLLPPTSFAFDDRGIRASSIHTTLLGHRADDVSKYGYLSLWLPGGPDDGAVDFRRYSMDGFDVVDASGNTVFSGRMKLRVGPTDPEPGGGYKSELLTYTRADGTPFKANRAGTYVFGLDYSAWRGAQPGFYRLAIKGLGVSDPFRIGDDVWHQAARVAMSGLYHQRSGMALDGRFGYTRPECFTERVGITVRQSRLPLALSSEGGTGSFVNFSLGTKSPWITDEIVQNIEGGYQDAGDWDRNAAHIKTSYLLLDLYEQLPSDKKNARYDAPGSGEVLHDPRYRGKDFPDLVDEAVWNLDFFRRMQRADGGVRGGIDSGGSPRTLEPSWLESQPVFVYSPDLISTFWYAAGASKLVIVLRQLGERELADFFQESALRAWSWAERALSQPNLGMDEARQLLGLDDAAFQKRLIPLDKRARDAEAWAAATLFRLTGQEEFNQKALPILRGRYEQGAWDAAWEYLNAAQPDADPALQSRVRADFVRFAKEYIAYPRRKNDSYLNLKHIAAPMGWGEGLAPSQVEISTLIRAHRITGSVDFLAPMMAASAHILGANQIGMSFTTGIGKRAPLAPLHEDSIAAGVSPPTGITLYGWALPSSMIDQYPYVWGAEWAVMSDRVPDKRVAPDLRSLPLYEFLIQYPRVIISAEYTMHQTIATTASMWIYLDARKD